MTLEGVPSYFVKRRPLLIDILREELPARHHRLSMGIQTFDEAQLRRMGRLAFGTADTFREVVELGHRQGFTVSADLLFNLPGLTNEKLVTIAPEAIRPTPRGVFYADTIAALFDWRQVQRLRFSARQRGPDKAKEQSAYDNGRGHM